MARSRRRITSELLRAKREGKGRRREWQPRGELIPPNRVHVPKTSYTRKRIGHWTNYLTQEPMDNEEE